MNVNVKISLTDEERNTLYRRITGKDVKRMISRKEVCELVQQHIDDLLEGIEQVVETVAEPVFDPKQVYKKN